MKVFDSYVHWFDLEANTNWHSGWPPLDDKSGLRD